MLLNIYKKTLTVSNKTLSRGFKESCFFYKNKCKDENFLTNVSSE